MSGDALIALLLAAGLLMMFLSVRSQILTVQDRLIRLEMRLRLKELMPVSMHSQIPSLSIRQLVALRFASDAELPELAAHVLAGKLATEKEIKMRVRDWQADYQRA